MSSKIKTALIGLALVFVILIIVSLLTPPAPTGNSPAGNGATSQNSNPAAPEASQPPAAPAMQTKELRLEVLVVNQDATYRVRDVDANTESDLFIPSDANITAGSREAIKEGTLLSVQKFMQVSNGLVAVQLSIPTVQ